MDKVLLPGSERQEQPGSHYPGVPFPHEQFSASVILHPRSSNGERFLQQPDQRILRDPEIAAV
jgi:hypothetical protein